MKKNLFILSALGLSAASSLMLSACRDYDVMDEEVAKEIATKQEYYDNFVKEFGVPDPNHTWGFGITPEMADAILGNTRAGTRAGADDHEGRVNVNRNMWCTESDPYSLLNVYGVPGWPNDDGRYYTQEGTYTNGRYPIHTTKQSQCNMPGDVTEFEILWVSNYVHEKGAALKSEHQYVHVSEYYIQDISCNNDYATETDYKSGITKSYGGIGNNGTNYSYSEYNMDKLDAMSIGSTSAVWTHVNNNNAGMNRQPNLHVGDNHDRNIIFVQSSGTEDFQYHPSLGTDNWYNKFVLIEVSWKEPYDPDWSIISTGQYTLEYALEHPQVLDPSHPLVDRTGYYICFDYMCEKPTEGWPKYEGDDIYDNWILKLSPGYPIPKNRWPKRLMCEDLGNTFDFDFNDAVFDLSFAQNVGDPSGRTYDMVVVIQAAGGTMPIYVALDPNGEGRDMEIHKLLGNNSSTTPVNVIEGGASSGPAMYRYKNAFTIDTSKVPLKEVSYTDEEGNTHTHYVPTDSQNDVLLAQMAAAAFKMNIYIINGTKTYTVSGYQIYASLRDPETGGYNNGNKGSSAFPQLFNCSADAMWTKESHHIKKAYQHFPDWVQNEQGDYRLRWDETQYYKRGASDSDLPYIDNHTAEEIASWKGSWDYEPKPGYSTTDWWKNLGEMWKRITN